MLEFQLCLTGSGASWEFWDTGLILSPAQWVKDPKLPQLWRVGCSFISDLIPGPRTSMCCGVAKKEKKKEIQGVHKYPHILLTTGRALSAALHVDCLFSASQLELLLSSSLSIFIIQPTAEVTELLRTKFLARVRSRVSV